MLGNVRQAIQCHLPNVGNEINTARSAHWKMKFNVIVVQQAKRKTEGLLKIVYKIKMEIN